MTTAAAPTTNTPTSNTSNSSSTTSGLINQGLSSVATNYTTFLTLLTTQLKNQDPTSPMDTAQFTSQLTAMTGVEQQLLSNQLLQQLVSAQSGLPQAASLIGKTVSAPGAASTDPAISGVVTGVQQVNGQVMLTVGGKQVAESALTSVSS